MRVGTSEYPEWIETYEEDHPHACGDKCQACKLLNMSLGSSPCVWGQDRLFTNLADSLRIIPMRVGTRFSASKALCSMWDHPHACGDKEVFTSRFIVYIGSSPCVWGQVICNFYIACGYGIIPMRVGTRLKKSRKIAVLQNQPLRFPLTFHRSFV